MAGMRWLLAAGVSIVALLAPPAAGAQTSAATKEQIERMEAQLAALKRDLAGMQKKLQSPENANAQSAEKAHAAAAPISAAPSSGPTVKMPASNRAALCSADGRNCIAFTSRIQFDAASYDYRPNTRFTAVQHLDSGINARRAQIGVQGSFLGDWTYALIYDFGGSTDAFGLMLPNSITGGYASGIVNAYVSYSGIKQLAVMAGYIDVPYTLEGATSSNDLLFLERASPQAVAAAIAAGIIRSAVGARWNNDWFWAGAYFTGPTAGAVHNASSIPGFTGLTEQYGAFGRVAAQVVNQKDATVHIGGNAEFLFKAPLNGTTGIRSLTLSDRPELRVDPTPLLSTGAIPNVNGVQVYSAEAAVTYGPLFLQGEYFWFNVERQLGRPDLRYKGGYAEASWSITGEAHPYSAANANYNNIIPKNPFSWSGGGWGAWEVATRYSVIDLNDRVGFADGTAGGRQTVYTVGLNWYATQNIKFMLDYFHGIIDKQKSALDTTNVGAKFDAVAMRTQVAF